MIEAALFLFLICASISLVIVCVGFIFAMLNW